MSHRILLVDDEVDILEFVRYNLVREGYEVFTAENGAQALQVAAACRPHLILLDMMMPVMDGIETCRAIRRDPQLKDTMVVFLSALGEEEQQLSGFGVGADDYLTKPIKMKLLVSRVQALLKRVDSGTPTAGAEPHSGITIDRERYTATCDGREIVLPRKEFALLDLLCSQPGRLVTREEIYSRIWGSDVVVGDRTIDVHIRKLRQKIGDRRIVTVKGVGYKSEPCPPPRRRSIAPQPRRLNTGHSPRSRNVIPQPPPGHCHPNTGPSPPPPGHPLNLAVEALPRGAPARRTRVPVQNSLRRSKTPDSGPIRLRSTRLRHPLQLRPPATSPVRTMTPVPTVPPPNPIRTPGILSCPAP